MLYFLITEMSMVNVMYQTSLKQFLGIFDLSMAKSKKSPITTKRIDNIIDYLTFAAFKYTSRGLYEVDKLLFTVLMTLKIEINGKRIRGEEFQTFIKGKEMDIKFFVGSTACVKLNTRVVSFQLIINMQYFIRRFVG